METSLGALCTDPAQMPWPFPNSFLVLRVPTLERPFPIVSCRLVASGILVRDIDDRIAPPFVPLEPAGNGHDNKIA